MHIEQTGDTSDSSSVIRAAGARPSIIFMAYKATTIEDLLAIMKRVQGEKTLTQFAAELDLSKQYLSNVLNRNKEPSERLLDKLGFTRQPTYVRSPTAARKEKKK